MYVGRVLRITEPCAGKCAVSPASFPLRGPEDAACPSLGIGEARMVQGRQKSVLKDIEGSRDAGRAVRVTTLATWVCGAQGRARR